MAKKESGNAERLDARKMPAKGIESNAKAPVISKPKSSLSQYHRYRNALISSLGGHCFHCGTESNIQFHHPLCDGIHGIGGWQQVLDLRRRVKNHENIMLLCVSCHKIEHERMNARMIRGYYENGPYGMVEGTK